MTSLYHRLAGLWREFSTQQTDYNGLAS